MFFSSFYKKLTPPSLDINLKKYIKENNLKLFNNHTNLHLNKMKVFPIIEKNKDDYIIVNNINNNSIEDDYFFIDLDVDNKLKKNILNNKVNENKMINYEYNKNLKEIQYYNKSIIQFNNDINNYKYKILFILGGGSFFFFFSFFMSYKYYKNLKKI
jgi:hypothetical protein